MTDTSTPTQSPEAKALAYVEKLGLNTVYNEAVAARNELDNKHRQLLELRNQRRQAEQTRADLEMEVIEEERGKHPDMSQAAMDKHLRVAFSNSGDIREARDSLSILAGEIDFVEFEIDRIHQDIKIAFARLDELGGYFRFMAVIKQAEIDRNKSTHNEKDPWKP